MNDSLSLSYGERSVMVLPCSSLSLSLPLASPLGIMCLIKVQLGVLLWIDGVYDSSF